MIVDQLIFDAAALKIEAAAVTANRIPRQVFRPGHGHFAFVEFRRFSGPEFWALLQALAASLGDAFITTVAVEPHPVDYFHKEFGMYGAIQLDATAASVPAIIGLKDGFEPSLRSSAGKADVHLFSLEDALSLASLDFRGQVVPEQWETEFRSNYGG